MKTAPAPLPEPLIVSATLLQQLFLYLRSLGVDPQSVAAPDAYIPNATYLLIQDAAAEYIHDPYLGLHMGEYAEAGSWSILGCLMMNCRTLDDTARLLY